MSYEETIGYLYQQLPMFSRIGAAAYKEDLHNTIQLCGALNNPENQFKSIHVAGTNGKGSTSHMLAAIFQEAGYKTGLYTSPHIKDFRERIKINGEMVRKEFIVDFVQETRDLSMKIQPSFFELTVAMAYKYFAEEKVDIAIIETGLGGRLDSTNVISPVLSVITNIGFDHTEILGNTLSAIAGEKAGIIKDEVPVVIGEILPETMPVFVKKANETRSEIHFASQEFIIEYIESSGGLLLCNMRDISTNIVEKFSLDLIGLYQTKNVCTVLCCVKVLRKIGYDLPEEALHKALENVISITGFRGRWEILQTKPTVVLDVAHNVDGIRQVIDQLMINYPTSGYHFVLGFVHDKDISSALALFPADAKYYFTNAHIPRALAHNELKKMAGQAMLMGESFDDVNSAIQQAKSNAKDADVILVCGSFFVIAEVDFS